MSIKHKFLPGSRSQPADRRNDYDVTNTVKVSSVAAVRDAVQTLFSTTFPTASFDALWLAFHDFNLLFDGLLPGYQGCDTVYHDKQHSLDMTLAMARLLVGHEKICAEEDRFGPDRAMMSIVTALFHDAGYIRRDDESHWKNGAEVTNWHVSRSADLLRTTLPRLGLGQWADIAAKVVHFTGYEINIDDIELDNPNDIMIGHFLGTADLMAQMADRCYLEKCRDRLYPEFVLGGLAVTTDAQGNEIVLYDSGEDLLKKTPAFYENEVDSRLNHLFNKVYEYEIAHFDGERHYVNGLGKNQSRLKRVLKADDFSLLRRKPPENHGTKNFPGLEAFFNQHPLKKEKNG